MPLLRHLPNLLTILRIVLIPVLVALLLHGRYAAALQVFLVAGVSDALDGFIARRFNLCSRLGSLLDPLADKLLVVASALVLARLGLLPWWLALVVIGRDLVIVGGAVAYYRRTGGIEMAPSVLGKVNTFVQIVLVLAILVHRAGLAGLGALLSPLYAVTLALALVSGGEYVLVWGRKTGIFSRLKG